MECKRGYTTITLIGVIFIAIVLMLILGVLIYSFDTVDNAFSQIEFNITENISFSETYSETLGQGVASMKTTVPATMGSGILLGMILCMIFVGFATKKINRLWIMLDVFIIIVAEIGVALVQNSFTVFINSSDEMISIFSTTLSLGSKFIFNLHIIIPTLGVAVMIVTHIITKKDEEGKF